MKNKEIFMDHVLGMIDIYLFMFSRKRGLSANALKIQKKKIDFKPLAGSGGRSIKGMVLILTALIVYEGGNMSAKLCPLISNRMEVSLKKLFSEKMYRRSP